MRVWRRDRAAEQRLELRISLLLLQVLLLQLLQPATRHDVIARACAQQRIVGLRDCVWWRAVDESRGNLHRAGGRRNPLLQPRVQHRIVSLRKERRAVDFPR
jgi:hypothetical protein